VKTFLVAAICCSVMLLIPTVTCAIRSQWDLDPFSGDWNTAQNWTPNGAPNSPASIASFGLSNTTDVSISEDNEVNGITFTSAASNPYTITTNPGLTLTINGAGIKSSSGITHPLISTGVKLASVCLAKFSEGGPIECDRAAGRYLVFIAV